MPLTDPGDGGRPEPSRADGELGESDAAGQRPTIDSRDGGRAEPSRADDDLGQTDVPVVQPLIIGALDGDVSRRLVRRCRTAASILLAIGIGFLLLVAAMPWGVISVLAALAAGALIVDSFLLLRRGALWSQVAGSELPVATLGFAGTAPPVERAEFDSAGPSVPGVPATIGPPRQLSPGLAGAPVKRRLSSSVVPIYADAGPSPGDGALVVHARADGKLLTEGDRVLVWLAAKGLSVHYPLRQKQERPHRQFGVVSCCTGNPTARFSWQRRVSPIPGRRDRVSAGTW